MDPRVRHLLDRQGGVTSSAQAVTAGVSRHELFRLVRRRTLLRLPRGILVDPVVWEASASWDRRVLLAKGLMFGPPGDPDSRVALSHQSALAVLGVAVLAVDQRLHTVRNDGRRSKSDSFLQAHPPVSSDWVLRKGRLRLVRPELAALQVAAASGAEAALVSMDSALHEGLVTPEDLRRGLAAHHFGNGARHARQAVDLADARPESVGESRCRWLFALLGLPQPTPQVTIRDERGGFVARVDFLFEAQRTIVEFDGQVKYTSREVLFQEKQREDALRALGYAVVRITWNDLAQPGAVRAKLLRAFRLAAA